MKHNKNTFRISDESVNSYGLIVKTDGINLDRFIKNPVMLYSHSTEGGNIGRWENIRTENNALYADAVFYEKDERAKAVKEKVESGFLRGCSISIDVVELKGNTITKSNLLEVSICDIPSNENALKLSYKDKPVTDFKGLLKLQIQEEENEKNNFEKSVCELLGLDENTDESEILAELKKRLDNSEKQINNACKKGLILQNERQAFLSLANTDKKAFESLLKDRAEQNKSRVVVAVNNAFLSTKTFGVEQKPILVSIGERMGLATLEKVIEMLPNRVSLAKLIKEANKEIRGGLDWYRKNDPETLKNNPQLFNDLLEQEKRK